MRALVGVLLILHGLAHAGAGMWTSGPVWLVAILWCVATVSFIAAGLRLLRVELVPAHYKWLVMVGASASILLFVFFRHVLSLPGIALDALFVAMAMRWQGIEPPHTTPSARWRAWVARVAVAASTVFLVYAASVILLRPWHMRWGTTSEDRAAPLFGDSLAPTARYIVNHAVTISAPADSVWPWLVQLGQDRAGFYSYSRLERFAGARITNVDSIVPEWQHRQVGDLVRAVPPDWFGGRFGPNLGWHIVALDSGRALVLENWGAFVARPIDAKTTRMQIRQRNPGTPSVLGTILAPAGLLVFEPAHFIMQRGMLLGIKARAERSLRS